MKSFPFPFDHISTTLLSHGHSLMAGMWEWFHHIYVFCFERMNSEKWKFVIRHHSSLTKRFTQFCWYLLVWSMLHVKERNSMRSRYLTFAIFVFIHVCIRCTEDLRHEEFVFVFCLCVCVCVTYVSIEWSVALLCDTNFSACDRDHWVISEWKFSETEFRWNVFDEELQHSIENRNRSRILYAAPLLSCAELRRY